MVFENPYIIGTVIGIIVLIIGSLALTQYAGMIKISAQEYFNESVFTDTALKASFGSFFKVTAVLFLGLIMFLPVVALYYFPIRYAMEQPEASMPLDGAFGFAEILGIVIAVIFMLSIIFAVLFYMTWFSFVLQAIVIEKKGVFASIKRSISLVRHSYWRIFGSMLLITFVIYGIQISLQSFVGIVSGILYLIAKFFNISEDFMVFFAGIMNLSSFPLTIISWLIVTPIAYIMYTLLYFNERFKKEGFDLLLRLKQLQKNDERKQVGEVGN
jgi:hypothetical protein